MSQPWIADNLADMTDDAKPDEIDLDTSDALGTESAPGAAAAPDAPAQMVIPEVEVLPFQPPVEVVPLQGTALPLETDRGSVDQPLAQMVIPEVEVLPFQPPVEVVPLQGTALPLESQPDPLDRPPVSETAAESAPEPGDIPDVAPAPFPDPIEKQMVSDFVPESGDATRGDADTGRQPDPHQPHFPHHEGYFEEHNLGEPPFERSIPEEGDDPWWDPTEPEALDQPPVSELLGKGDGRPVSDSGLEDGKESTDYADPFDAPTGLQTSPATPFVVATPPADGSWLADKTLTPDDSSVLVGKVSTPAGKVSTPTGKIEGFVGKVSTPTGKVSTPTGKVSTPTGKVSLSTEKVPVPVAKRGAPQAMGFPPVALLALALLIVLVIVAIGVFSGGLLGGAPTNAPTLLAATTPTASAPVVVGTSPATSATPIGSSDSGPLKSDVPPATQANPSAVAPPPTAKPTVAPVPTKTPQPTRTPSPSPKPTTPPPVLDLKVIPQEVSASCKDGLTPFDLTLNNSGSTVAAQWSIKFNNSSINGPWGVVSPQSGTVEAGAVDKTTITPADLCAAGGGAEDFVLEVAFGGDSPQTVIYHFVP